MNDNSAPNERSLIKQFILRLLRLLFGLFLYALGIVFTLRASIGYAPWEVFHAGLAKVAGISFGTASIAVGAVICICTIALGEKLGLGTILNMVLIGLFIDLLLYLNIIPASGDPGIAGKATGVFMLFLGLFTISTGSFFYIGSGFGAGPRDSLMVAIRRMTGLPVGICRSAIELTALTAGWCMGGMAGVGTVVSMLAIGLCIQLTFRFFKFSPETVTHETLADTYGILKKFFAKTL